MARTTQKAVLADRQNPAQPALFDDRELPVALPVLEAVRSGRYEHKGERLLEDEQKAVRLVELICLKWGVKRISAEMHISAHTVRAARRALVAQGKLAPYKQRIVEAMEDAIEAGVSRYRDALEEGLIPAAQIPVGAAILFDKRALAMGEPTSISGQGAAAPEEVRPEDINRYLSELPSCKPPEDSPSSGSTLNPEQTRVNPPADATLDATSPQPTAPALGNEELPLPPAAEAVEAAPDQANPTTPGGRGSEPVAGNYDQSVGFETTQ